MMRQQQIQEAIQGRIFLVGCPRSGTTLLQAFIAAHPQIASFPESHFFKSVKKRGLVQIGLAPPGARAKLHHYLDEIGHSEMKVKVPSFGFLVRQYVDAFAEILDTLTLAQGKIHWLEKTPGHLHYINLIEYYIRDARFIHIIRNGTDVVASLYEVTHQYPHVWGGPRDITQCITRWNDDIRITKQHINKPNHMLVKYEQMVKEPEVVLKSVCTFIDVEYKPEMVKKHHLIVNKIMLQEQVWIHGAGKEIYQANSEKFDRIFDDEQKKYILSLLSQEFSDLC